MYCVYHLNFSIVGESESSWINWFHGTTEGCPKNYTFPEVILFSCTIPLRLKIRFFLGEWLVPAILCLSISIDFFLTFEGKLPRDDLHTRNARLGFVCMCTPWGLELIRGLRIAVTLWCCDCTRTLITVNVNCFERWDGLQGVFRFSWKLVYVNIYHIAIYQIFEFVI